MLKKKTTVVASWLGFIVISVNINGVEGLAGAPGTFKNSFGVVERKPGIVTWYKKPLLYTVYGDGYIPVDKLIKIARLF